MKAITSTLNDIKSIKYLMDRVDSLKESSLVINGYSENNGNKDLIIEAKEKAINENVDIVANLLGVDFNTVIDMCYDFEFAKFVLNNKANIA
jgi:hypothetical protein